MKVYHDIIQQTEEWHELKKLKMSASHAQAIGNYGAGLKTYINDLILDAIRPRDSFSNHHMERGNELEPLARQAYEMSNDCIVTEVGFILHNEYCGCSPDGLVMNGEEMDGGIEIKARDDKEHLRLLEGGKIDTKTVWQIQMNLLITGAKWWDFISYNPNFKRSSIIRRVFPDNKQFNELRIGIEKGKAMLIEKLNSEAIKYELGK